MGEKSSSVVQCTKTGCVFTVGEVARVQFSAGAFQAVIIASGKKLIGTQEEMDILMKEHENEDQDEVSERREVL